MTVVGELDSVWRVGSHADPLGLTPRHLYAWAHRFDDAEQRFRSVYAAVEAETALREVLADLRPNAAAIARYVELFGEDAREDIVGEPVTAAWRRNNVLAPARIYHTGVLDLEDAAVRAELESRHAELLADHGMEHLDLHELTTRQRAVTQAIATDVYHRLGIGVIRFASSRDGGPCFAVLEGHGELESTGADVALTDPPPEALVTVAAEWGLELEPT